MSLTPAQRKARLQEALNGYDRSALTTAEFRRQLRLACNEGLLIGLLREIALEDHRAVPLGGEQSVALDEQAVLETRTTRSQRRRHIGQRILSEPSQIKSSMTLIERLRNPQWEVLPGNARHLHIEQTLADMEEAAGALATAIRKRDADSVIISKGVYDRLRDLVISFAQDK